MLPYGTEGDGRNNYSNIEKLITDYGTVSPAGEELCHVKVVIANGVTVTNNGTIEVAGHMKSGTSGSPYSSVTAGEHARLELDTNATIVNNGIIYAAGFIREVKDSTGSQIIMNGGSKLYQPYTVCDFKGGTITSNIYTSHSNVNMTPFNLFLIMNVSPEVVYKYGSELRVWASLAARASIFGSTKANNTEATFIGGTGAVIQWTEAGAYISAKYNPDNEVMDLHFYGGVKTNAMSMKVSGIDISTANAFFPLTYHHRVMLHKLDDQTEATYTMDQLFKLMPGSVFVVDEGVHVTVKTLVVYEEATSTDKNAEGLHNGYLTGCTETPHVAGIYPTSTQLAAKPGMNDIDCTAGTLIVNGRMTVTAKFAGKVHSKSDGAIVQINGAIEHTAVEPHLHDGQSGSYKLTENNTFYLKAALINGNGTTPITPTAGTTYTYSNGAWKQPVVYISFNANGGNGVGTIGVPFEDGIYQGLPTPTKEHYTFVCWKDAEGNIIENGVALPEGCVAGSTLTLTAEWELINYTIKYQGIDKDGNTIDWTMDDDIFTADDGSFSLPAITNPTGYTHVGWRFGGKNITSLTLNECLAAVKETTDGTITIQVLFESSDNTYEYSFNLGDVYDGLGYSNQMWPLGTNPEDYPELIDQLTGAIVGVDYETSIEHQWYFVGWYTDADFTREYTENYEPTDAEKSSKTITLYAKWESKVSIKYTANNTSIYTGLIKNGNTTLEYGKTYWFKPDTITLPNVTANDSNNQQQYYFKGWTLNGETFAASNAGKSYELNVNTEINITWGTKTTVNITFWDGTLTVTTSKDGKTLDTFNTSSNIDPAKNYYFRPGTITVDYSPTNTYEIIFKINDSNASYPYTTTIDEGANFKIYADSNPEPSTCITADTLVTLADGTQKRADELTYDDELLVWDFYNGCYTSAPLSILFAHEECVQAVLYLYFSDGTTAKVIQNHGFFDTAVNNFVYIGADNVDEFIGHSFIKANADTCGEVTLIGYEVIEELNTAYWVQTAVHNNAITDGMLTIVTPDYEGWFDYFNITDDMKYDEEHMRSEIEKYGLFTYEDLAEFGTYEQFVALNGQYMKILIGRGVVTMEEILALLETYG